MYHSLTFAGQVKISPAEAQWRNDPVHYPSGGTITIVINTWDRWRLIPTSRPDIAVPQIETNYQDVGGTDGQVDYTEYIPGRVAYGPRTGSIEFYIDNTADGYDLQYIRTDMLYSLHGKRLYMAPEDDPGYYYVGRFMINNWQTDAHWSKVTIGYELEPYKRKIKEVNINVPIDEIIFNDV